MEMQASVKLILAYMKLNGLSQRDLCVVLGTDEAQLSKWINGKHNPCRAWQMRIGEMLGNIEKPKVGKMVRQGHEVITN
jgi:transcriptional regulator with XRE-family HTH domain